MIPYGPHPRGTYMAVFRMAVFLASGEMVDVRLRIRPNHSIGRAMPLGLGFRGELITVYRRLSLRMRGVDPRERGTGANEQDYGRSSCGGYAWYIERFQLLLQGLQFGSVLITAIERPRIAPPLNRTGDPADP